MADNSRKIDYIDTQGLSPKMTPEEAAKFKSEKREYKPMVVKPRRLLEDNFVKEIKILINEVLDEREYKKRLKGPYDIHGEVDELPPSYFDTEHFKHYVGEDEPPYQDWSQE